MHVSCTADREAVNQAVPFRNSIGAISIHSKPPQDHCSSSWTRGSHLR